MRGLGHSTQDGAPRIPHNDLTFRKGEPILYVHCGHGIVFLDLVRDDYACCYDPGERIASYHDLTQGVGRQGVDRQGLDYERPVLHSRWTDAAASEFPVPSVRHFIHFLLAMATAIIRFRKRSVAELGAIADRLGRKKGHPSISAQQAANLFGYFLAILPTNPECLFRSFALLHFLDRYGLQAEWVFGVQLFPFRAHCWIAAENVLLNELREGIEDYEVIWTVRGDRS